LTTAAIGHTLRGMIALRLRPARIARLTAFIGVAWSTPSGAALDPLALDTAACALDLARAELGAVNRRCPGFAETTALATADRAETAAATSATPPEVPASRKGRARGKAEVVEVPAPLLEAWQAAETARRAHPDETIQRALVAHLGRRLLDSSAARAGAPVPAALRWPLPDARLPTPALPGVQDATLQQARESFERAAERRRDLHGRVGPDSPEQLRAALVRVDEEYALLLRKLTAAYEDALEKDPEFPRAAWLALAHTYALQDQALSEETRRARAEKLLLRLRKVAPQETAASLAGLWIAAFQWERGDLAAVAAVLDEGALLDPTFAALLESLAAWRRGQTDVLARALPTALQSKDAATRAQALALQADEHVRAGKSLDAALVWRKLVDALVEPEDAPARAHAQIREAMAWADALVAGAPVMRVTDSARDDVTRLLVRLDRWALAEEVYRADLASDPTRPNLVGRGLALVDGLGAHGFAAEADALLLELVRTFVAPGPFQSKHGKSPIGAAARDALAARLIGRITGPLDAGQPLDDALRARLGPLVEARLSLFPQDADPLETARRLGAVGFADRAAVLLKQVRSEDPTPARRLQAARALVAMHLSRARSAGRAGAPLGGFFDGPPATRGPLPPEVRALVDAQVPLLRTLAPGPERDTLLLDHLQARLPFQSTDDLESIDALLDQLNPIVDREPNSALALRAVSTLLTAVKPERAARDAARFARRRVGPPEHEAALKATLAGLPFLKAGDPAASLLAQRLFDRAAQVYGEQAQRAADADTKAQAQVAQAAALTLGLRVRDAIDAWSRFVASAPQSPYAPAARAHLADLLLSCDLRTAARPLLEQLARTDSSRAVDALSELVALDAEAATPLRGWLTLLAAQTGSDPRIAAAQARLAALGPGPGEAASTTAPLEPARAGVRFFPRAPR
jgi:hypothetical protein